MPENSLTAEVWKDGRAPDSGPLTESFQDGEPEFWRTAEAPAARLCNESTSNPSREPGQALGQQMLMEHFLLPLCWARCYVMQMQGWAKPDPIPALRSIFCKGAGGCRPESNICMHK